MLLCSKWRPSREFSPDGLDSAVEVQTVADLCHHPQRLVEALMGGQYQRLVLGLCPGKYSLGEVQAQTRKAGLDPLGVELVHLGRLKPAAVQVVLSAAVARARAFTLSLPAHSKPYLSPLLSGRALFKVNLSAYRAVVTLDRSRCAADRGCRLCARACPQKALRYQAGALHFEKVECDSCGLCLTVCPTAALFNPAQTPDQLEAQVAGLLRPPGPQPRGLVFSCRDQQPPELPAGWFPVSLPCVAMAPPTWLLAPLLMGAAEVLVTACSCGDTPRAAKVEGAVDFSQELLVSLGAPRKLVRLAAWPTRPPKPPLAQTHLEKPFGPQGPSRVIRALVEAFQAPELDLAHPASPLGEISLDLAACTRCGRCAETCPTGALTLEEAPEGSSLTFTGSACVACGLCLPVCPELAQGGLRLTKGVTLATLNRTSRQLYQESAALCQACGGTIAPQSMLAKVKELLGDQERATLANLERYCPACRATPNALYGTDPPEVVV